MVGFGMVSCLVRPERRRFCAVFVGKREMVVVT